MRNEEWSAAPIINEELRILHSYIAAKRESFNIPNSKLNIKYYETRDLETAGADRHHDPDSDQLNNTCTELYGLMRNVE